MLIIDTDGNTSRSLADLTHRGVTTIGRYYSRTGSWKELTAAEAKLINAAGFSMFVIFEEDGDPTLSTDTGKHHAQLAVQQAQEIGQPHGSAIYFALEHLPNGYTAKDVAGAKAYVEGIKSVLGSDYKLGVYSDGVICIVLLNAELCDYAWLSASRKFPESQQFYDSKQWTIAQSPKIDQQWGTLSVDTNETQGDFGAFRIGGTGSEAPASTAHAPSPVDRLVASQASSPAVPAPPSGFVTHEIDIASKEWEFFGQQTYDLAGHRAHAGHTEAEEGFYERIGTYWLDGTGTHGLDGRNIDHPWSAAFISWVMKTAGAGTRFRYSTQHSVYIAQGIRDFLTERDAAGFWTVRLGDARPKLGDLVCWARQPGVDYDHQMSGNYKGHSDVIVDVGGDEVQIIGGNVGNSVTKRPLKLDASGFLPPLVENGETLFGLMQCRL